MPWFVAPSPFQVRNHELFYEAINFYLDEHPLSLGKLLQVLTTKLDHARVVHQLRRSDNLPLILPFMKSVQKVCERMRAQCGPSVSPLAALESSCAATSPPPEHNRPSFVCCGAGVVASTNQVWFRFCGVCSPRWGRFPPPPPSSRRTCPLLTRR